MRLAEFLVENGISGAPVITDEGTLIGVVSLTDIVRHDSMPQRDPQPHAVAEYYVMGLEGQFSEEEFASFRFDGTSDVTVRDIMTPTLFNVREDTSLAEVANLMIKGRIHRVFVTRGSVVVGLITALDMLKVIRDC